jgi:uncharacterized protein YbdZ (MbtH family)
MSLKNTPDKSPQNGVTIDGNFFVILINDDGQYSLWPALKDIPPGWVKLEFSGSKDECTAYIDENWKNIQPKSLNY